MARPIKEGLEYFPLDCDIDQDDKIALIEAQTWNCRLWNSNKVINEDL